MSAIAGNGNDGAEPPHEGPSRRRVLECMTWAGSGVLWTIAAGVPRSVGLIGEAKAQSADGLTFLQISDSHVGFDKPANPNVIGTLEEAIGKIRALPAKPAFIHMGDITHLSKEREFDDADRIIAQSRVDVHYASTTFSTRSRSLLRPRNERRWLVQLRRERRPFRRARQCG